MRIFYCTLILLYVAISPLAWADESIGPKVGEQLPVPLSASDERGELRSFDDLAGANGLVLVFFRSAEWCPYCKNQLKELAARQSDITAKGYALAGVSYDPTKILSDFARKNDLGFPLLSDPDSVIIRGFNLLNKEIDERSRAYGIPYPMLVIVDKSGVVRATLSEDSYRDRPEIDALISALDAVEMAFGDSQTVARFAQAAELGATLP